MLRQGTNRVRARSLALISAAALMIAGLGAGAQPASAGCAFLVFCAKPAPSAPPSGPLCTQMGSTDFNPGNQRVEPTLGRPLFPRRPDGHLPFGFVDYSYFQRETTLRQDGSMLRRVGANIFRIAIPWGGVERTPGVYDFNAYDRIYCNVLAYGLRPMFTVYGTPQWAAPPGARCTSVHICLREPAPQYESALERFVETFTIRYPQLAAVEAWNEPNAADHWDGPNPAEYLTELRLVYTGVKDGNPSIPVLGGGLANHQFDLADGSISVFNFLSAMYDDGAGAYMDGISFHPYPVNPLDTQWDLFDRTVNGVRPIIEAHDGVGQRHMWFTEVAAAAQSTPTPSSAAFSPTGQMRILRDIYFRSEAMPDVDAIVYNSLVDPTDAPPFGFVHRKNLFGSFYAKPVYCDFASRLGTPTDCSQPIPMS